MTDIERRLRDLGERMREEQGSSALKPNMIRAAKRRRLATALGATLTVVALVSGVTYAASSLTDKPEEIGPANEKSESLIDYQRTGGFEGSDTRLTISPEGHSVLHRTQGTGGSMIEGELSELELRDLRDVIAAIAWPAIHGRHAPAPGVGVMDGYEYEIRHEDYVVTMISGAEPRELKPLIEFLDAVIEIQWALHEPSEPSRCGPPVGFEPTYLPEGWSRDLQRGTGAGGQSYPGLVGHYGETGIGYYDLVSQFRPFAQSNKREIRVLGGKATLGDIHEGFSVEFKHDGCTFFLIAYVFDRSELERFAEGLRLKKRSDGSGAPGDDATIWPEDTSEHSAEACTSAAHKTDTWRADPESTVLEFGALVLGWDEPVLTKLEEKGNQGSAYELRPEPSSRAGVIVSAVLIDQGWCWGIGSVSRLPQDQPQEDGSMSVRERDVYMGFDKGEATTALFQVGYGGQKTSHVWRAGDAEAVEFRLDFEPRGTGHFLVLLRDENGEVFSAFGSPLPEGDFAAG
jgi:hypothetical protein